jgi:prokaryotic ubiquitin-like protein Pup
MPQQRTAYRPTPTSPTTPAAPPVESAAIEDLDDFLDEVDDLLEENALEVLRAYVQRGGQ